MPLMPIIDRLAAHAERDARGCLTWTSTKDKDGYGYLTIVNGPVDPERGRSPRINRRVHVVAFELAHGPIPLGLDVGHLCHDRDLQCPGGPCSHRACFDLEHLALQTRTQNILGGRNPDMQRARNALITHCPQGHPYDDENTYWRSDRPAGGRQCRTCRRARRRECDARRRQERGGR